MYDKAYCISRLILPGSVSADDIRLEIYPAKRRVKIVIKKGKLSTKSFVGLGMSLNADPKNFEALIMPLSWRERSAPPMILQTPSSSTYLFFKSEACTSQDLHQYPSGHGLRRVQYDRNKDDASIFYWVLKKAGTAYNSSNEVAKAVATITDTVTIN
jgi:hypothetical protein